MDGEVVVADYQLAYVSGLVYPSTAANALQTLHMAAAFARLTAYTGLFVRDNLMPGADLRQQYGIGDAPLRIKSLYVQRWPVMRSRSNVYNGAVAAYLGAPRSWTKSLRGVLMVRHSRQFWFWGQQRALMPHLRHWLFVYEAHDIVAENQIGDTVSWDEPAAYTRTRAALPNYDVVLAVTDGLVDDIAELTAGRVKSALVPLSSGLQRLDHAPAVCFDAERLVLGYVGTLDQAHGVEQIHRGAQTAAAALPSALGGAGG